MQILKLGGSVITKKQGYCKEDGKNIASLARAIARAWKSGVRDIVIVHGAGSFGHAPVLKYCLNNGVRTRAQKKGCRITQRACSRLSSFVVSALKKSGVKAVSIPPHEIIKSKNRRIASFDTRRIKNALKAKIVPVLYGDMVPDSKLGFSPCSGDQLTAYLGRKAKRMILGTNVDGVLAKGKVVATITRRNFLSVAKHLTGSSKPDVTGGMAGKIREMMAVRKPAYIVNARKPARILALLLEKKAVGTKIRF